MTRLLRAALALLLVSSQSSHALSKFTARNIWSSGSLDEAKIQRVSFSESWSRYPSPDSILANLREDFPYAELSQMTESSNSNASNSSHCANLTKDNRAILGESDPISGAPATDRPNASFVSWYLGCVKDFVIKNDNGIQQITGTVDGAPNSENLNIKYSSRPYLEMRKYFTSAVFEDCGFKAPEPSETFDFNAKRCQWSQVRPPSREVFVKALIRRYIGPEDVLKGLGISESEQAYADQLLSELDDYLKKQDNRYQFLDVTSAQRSARSSSSNGEQLSIREAMKIVQFLIHLQDTLKY